MTPNEIDQLAETVAERLAEKLTGRHKLVDRHQIAEILGVSVPTIDRHLKDGRIPIVRVGRTVRFDPGRVISALEAMDNDHDQS